jgi:hypothetical protein
MPKLFEDLNFDSVTVASYMGKIQWSPFAFENKHTIMLCSSNEGALTSNVGCRRKRIVQARWKHLKPGRTQRI